MWKTMTYYSLLGVQPDADATIVRAAFSEVYPRCRGVCKRRVLKARKVLLDPEHRQRYNKELALNAGAHPPNYIVNSLF